MLSTPRLLFRQFTPADLDQLYREIYSHPEVARVMSPTGTISLQQTASLLARRLQHWQRHGFGAWALIHKQDQQLIGHCGLHYLADTPDVELTYTLNPAYWRQGLATEAGRAVLQWGFETLGLAQIVAVTGPSNIASQRVMQKLGMKYEKTMQYNGTAALYYTISCLEFDPNETPVEHSG
ncbi:GNAT family N-acetyltransferase [Leptolyngbya sp. 7M]|uniref:GNAT family N-acetyltransferase n=1 Tax=Leptolyngbya sp. 7M TaxID=2812896 RepID=UPI001B8B3A67|nr:GNAT family N-acetyltransferase [Leptolyngbya sp. 7M]QYO63325.1 GNAT family N-acetyltransferase [Leptolyngbya sp. 7M]